MKNFLKFPRILSTGLFCILLLPACKKQESVTSQFQPGDDHIVARDECDHCNGLGCCCWVELYNGDNAAALKICGTSSGMDACTSSNGTCSGDIDGLTEYITLNSSTNPKQIFCIATGHGIEITNISQLDDASIRCGCNTTSVDPEEYELSPQDQVQAETNASCELSDCSS